MPLANPGELHLDDCAFVPDDWMVFCSAREGNAREIDLYTATLRDPSTGSGPGSIWTDWRNWGELWFDAASLQGYPGPAVFRSLRQPDGSWGPREEIISSFAREPTLTSDGRTLYFVHARRCEKPASRL